MKRTWPLGPAILLAGLTLAACGGDDEKTDEPAATAPAQTEQAAAPEIEFATVERLTREYVSNHDECPPGEFVEVETTLTTLPDEYAERAISKPRSYGCGGRVDQVVYVQLEDEAAAQELLDPTNTSNATSLVAGRSVVLVNFGIEDESDIAGFFAAIQEECGCGETRYEDA